MATLRALWLAPAISLLLACGPQPPEHELIEAVGAYVRIPRAAVADGGVHFFTFEHDGTRVNFLVRSDAGGELRAHLDACYGCYQYKLGYLVEGADLVCRACRLEYPIADATWDFIGACAPIAVSASVDEDELLIPRRVLEKAARYF